MLSERDQQFLDKLMVMHTKHLHDKFISGSESHPDQSFQDMTLEELLTELYHEGIDIMHYAGAALLKLQEPVIEDPTPSHD
jgi:hypothetical protein